MSERAPAASVEPNKHEMFDEEHTKAERDLGVEAVEVTVQTGASEDTSDTNREKFSDSETVAFIDDYKTEHGTVHGLSMGELVKNGFSPDMILRKLGNERLEEKLDSVKINYGAERGTEQWRKMEEVEARYIPMTDDEIDALLEAGANPLLIVDALQCTEPEDGLDNPSSARIAARLDKLVEAGLPPSILSARLNPSWREATKEKLADTEAAWQQANRLKAAS
jgi:hypothetical protein